MTDVHAAYYAAPGLAHAARLTSNRFGVIGGTPEREDIIQLSSSPFASASAAVPGHESGVL